MEICEIIKSNTTNIFHDPIKVRRNDMKKISISAYETKEPGSVTNWGTGSIGDLIPVEEQEYYREQWESYQRGLNEDDWEEFKQNSRLERISLLTDNGWNCVEFNAANQMIYETIKNTLHD